MNPSPRKLLSIASLSLLVATTFTACETPGQTALLGAAIGGLAADHPLRGAAIGAGAGYLAGRLVQHERRSEYYDDRSDDGDRRYEGRPYAGRSYPLARRTDRFGFVSSPYPPYNLIDVRGIPRGAQVVDPSVNRVFINP